MAVVADSFHLLKDTRALFLKHLGSLLQHSGLVSGRAVQAIQDGAAAYFDEMTTTDRRGTFAEEADGLTSSRITLVGEDDLELGIRLDNLSARLYESTGGSLWRTHLRFVTLLRRPDLPKIANPIGPKGIAQGLNAMFEAAGAAAIDKKLELLDRIEACLIEGLPALYAEINDFLDRGGVEPAQPTIIGSQEGPVTTDAPTIRENALLALQQTLLARIPGMSEAIQFQPSGGGSGGAAASLLNQAMLERVMQRLDELDRRSPASPQPAMALESLIPGLFDADGTISQPKVLKSSELGIPSTASEGLAIDTLAMIFEEIFADPALPDALKAVISSLQITLLKVAMKDSSLFANEQHPARLVIDRMGLAVLGLPSDVPGRHAVCARLFEIAAELRSEHSGAMSAFDTAQAELDALITERNATIAAAASPYLPLIDALERRDAAAIAAGLAVEKFIMTRPPLAIRNFLENTWSQLLQTIWLEHGEASSEWQESLAIITDLLWTIQPKADPDERKTLARRLPDILKRLKTGMDRVSVSPEAETDFLDKCFELQTRALRATATPAASEEQGTDLFAGSFAGDAGAPLSGELTLGEQTLTTLDYLHFQPAPSRSLPCKEGDWVEFALADGTLRVARLCYIGPISRRLLLLNPDVGSGLVIAIHPAILDRQLRAGEAHIASARSLFERAASLALRQTTAN
ncbi:DUF1631 family protein [Dechloromonas sp. HYN0024]|uniref:DUF1631 family protein n=1 Tax=Dechloromonas sp. HYN0024 TaxID=2231055 RepID=UPI000E43BE17|nr:DUF1631 family protein [Dechloromonas sp. HYN0024]AXS81294.1 DUF1631 family protein [Dechloromonas sp. HYN0024]